MNSNISMIICEVLAMVIFAILTFFWKRFLQRLQEFQEYFINKRKKSLLDVTESQIKEFNLGRIQSTNERQDAINYLKNDVGSQIEKIALKQRKWQNKAILKILSTRNIIYLSIGMFILQIIAEYLRLHQTYLLVFSVLFLLIIYVACQFVIWIIYGQEINRELRIILKEINKSFLTLGPSLRINLFDLLSAIYESEPSKYPVEIQNNLLKLGIIIERKELMRVSFAYICRNKSETERIEIVAKILSQATHNPDKYFAIPEEERKDMELSFLNDYIDDPISEVRFVAI